MEVKHEVSIPLKSGQRCNHIPEIDIDDEIPFSLNPLEIGSEV